MAKRKMTQEIKGFIDTALKAKKALKYSQLIEKVAQRYGVRVSKATISKRAKALKCALLQGRKHIIPGGKQPTHGVFLDCAGAFFLKGAELESGLLKAVNQLLKPNTDSVQARKTLKLAQQINALLLYAPVFGLNTVQEIVGYQRRGLYYLSGQKDIPSKEEIIQYLDYLVKQKLLHTMIKEVTKIALDALLVRVNFAGKTFYLDAQSRTVWPNPKIPRYFNATLNKASSYINDVFQLRSAQRPLILQTAPGYTSLPSEAFNLIQCFNRAESAPISRIDIMGKFGETLAFWQGLKPTGKCYFIFPLNQWQYGRLQDVQIVKDFRQYRIGLEKENMSVADAQIGLSNPQLNMNIRVRAALVKRKADRLVLLTNISHREERYIRRIAEQYFSRWPDEKIRTYYDLMEGAYEEQLSRSQVQYRISHLLTDSYRKDPQNTFRLFLERLDHHVRTHFFSAEFESESFPSMREKFYQQSGYLKLKRHCWELVLRSFPQKNLQQACQIACHKFNQSDLRFPSQRRLLIHLK